MKKELDALDFLEGLLETDITTGKVIKARRRSLGLTQQDVADLTGMETSFISSVENDSRSIGVHTAVKLAVAIGLHPSTILFPKGVEFDEELKAIEKKRILKIKKKVA
jgi:transcriptional regulator with XRE-family HTH domain